ncbi:MAG: ABC transporter substrate-binding protein, partial [Micromonosporaceae bacterium]|nr:ABC transporter substrate-binding protein [Micromonosporaceae bacterium]
MNRPSHPATAVLSATLAVALGLTAACSAKSNNGTAAGGGGTLTVQGDAGNPTLVEKFNPFADDELGGTRLIYEPLEIPSPVDGTYTPFLATGYKFTDPTTLVYTIRQGVKWSDGKDFTPADVVFTFNLLKKFPALDTKGVWQQITNVAAAGNEVTFTFKAANVPYAFTLAQIPIVPEHIWSSVPDPSPDKFANTSPVGTGPYTLDKFAPTQVTLKKNPSYWQADKIVPDRVVFPAQASTQSTNQLDVTSGKFDWAYNFLPNVQQVWVARDPKHNTYWFPPGGTIGLYLNLTKAPYSDANFRKGISLSLNRQTIATKAVNGYLGPASQSGLILPNLQKWLDPSLPAQGVVSQDSAGAQAAFAKAGYQLAGGKLVKAGKQATMTIVMPGNFSDWVAAAKEVVTELAAVGIKASLDLPQYAGYSDSIQGGTFDAAIGGWGGNGIPYSDFNLGLASAFAAPVNTPTSNNFERFKDPTVDSALATLAAATDEAAQKQATYTLEQAMFNLTPVVLMYYGGSWGIFSTRNYTGWPSAQDPYTLPTSYNNALLVVV